MTEQEKFNTPLAQEAEAARRVRDGDPGSGIAQVKVGDQPVTLGGKLHDSGSTFSAPEDSVRDALARGLVERVERKGKGGAGAV